MLGDGRAAGKVGVEGLTLAALELEVEIVGEADAGRLVLEDGDVFAAVGGVVAGQVGLVGGQTSVLDGGIRLLNAGKDLLIAR